MDIVSVALGSLLIGIGMGTQIGKIKYSGNGSNLKQYNQQRLSERKQKLDSIIKLAKEKHLIQNQDVEKLLDVSHSTATNYLQELTEAGELRRHGQIGRSVQYSVES